MPLCWGIAGSAGMEAQVRALAAALNMVPEMKNLHLKKPFAVLPNVVWAGPLKKILPRLLEGEVGPPWPDLVISCGRRSALASLALRARLGGKPRFIHIQDPQIGSRHFDLVVAMAHDKIIGPNVLKTRFALHRITPALLAEAREIFAPRFADFPKPQVAVLLGGSTNKYRFTAAGMNHVIGVLQKLLASRTGSLMITPSRRTGDENIALLRRTFAGNSRVYVYDFADENPYIGLLALADAIIVTNDSVNMMSEAEATGKPVYILKLPGHENTKPARFARAMIADNIARPLADSLDNWTRPVSREMEWLTHEVKKRMALP